MSRQDTLAALKAQPNVSVLIVGGGINGVSAFRELALQGVDVLLVDRGDFSSGASAASSHMVHGGLRYLENSEFRLVQEALTERNRLLQNAPHMVYPLPTTVPMFQWFSGILNAPLKFLRLADKPRERGALIIKIGLMLYDAYARTQKSMPNHVFRGKEDTLRRFPGINHDVIMSATYYDAWMPYPERIALELILDTEAACEKAHALNYVSAVSAAGDTVELRDEISGETVTVKPSVVINAAGPWIDVVNAGMGTDTTFIGGTKGSHLVLDHPELHATLDGHEIFFENDDGRIVLIFPLEDRILAGTTDIRIDHPDDAVCTEEEIAYILTLIEKVFPKMGIGREHVVFTFSGVRPLPAQDAATTGQISRDHSVKTVEPNEAFAFPVLSLVGGKWTTFRAFGEKVAKDVLGRLNVPYMVTTENTPIGGGKDYPHEAQAQAQWLSRHASEYGVDAERMALLFRRYGTRAADVAAYCAAQEDAAFSGCTYTRREVQFIALEEKVCTLTDFVLRRSLLAMLGKLNHVLLGEIADAMGDVIDWDAAEREAQVAATEKELRERNLVMIKQDRTELVSETPQPA